LLKAVGAPPTFLVHSDRREPSPAAGHLLRIYPPLTPEVEALLAGEPPADLGSQPPPPAGSPLQELDTLDVGDDAAWNRAASFLPPPPAPAPGSALSPQATARTNPAPAPPQALAADTAGEFRTRYSSSCSCSCSNDPREQGMCQSPNRPRTGPSPTDKYWDRLLSALALLPAPKPATELREAAADPPAPDSPLPAPTPATDAAEFPEHLNKTAPEQPATEQAPNRNGTGPSASDDPAKPAPPPGAHDTAGEFWWVQNQPFASSIAHIPTPEGTPHPGRSYLRFGSPAPSAGRAEVRRATADHPIRVYP
jgi:hypothetical protein